MNPKQDTHKMTPRYIINSVLKTNNEEKILNINSSQSERHVVTQRGTEFKMIAEISEMHKMTYSQIIFSLKP